MFPRPTCSAETALEQAGMTMHQYIGQAVTAIDFFLGEGYAKKHPELIAAAIKCQVHDFNCVAHCAAIYTIHDDIQELICHLERHAP